jgi:hypothetical protein
MRRIYGVGRWIDEGTMSLIELGTAWNALPCWARARKKWSVFSSSFFFLLSSRLVVLHILYRIEDEIRSKREIETIVYGWNSVGCLWLWIWNEVTFLVLHVSFVWRPIEILDIGLYLVMLLKVYRESCCNCGGRQMEMLCHLFNGFPLKMLEFYQPQHTRSLLIIWGIWVCGIFGICMEWFFVWLRLIKILNTSYILSCC